MANIFLDTNCFIDAIHRNPEGNIRHSLKNQVVYISPLSFHIYCYIFKIKIPDPNATAQKEKFQIVELSEDIAMRALQGPTSDFEDNVQLHSAAEADCEIFLTGDKKLLDMKFFGKVKIESK